MAQALLRRKGGCAVFGHEPIDGGTANAHKICKNCGEVTSTSHSYSKKDEWNTSHSLCTVTWTCNCGYSFSDSYSREGYHDNPSKPADCVTAGEYECYIVDDEGTRWACPTWHPGSIDSSNHKGPFNTTSSGGNCVTAGSSTTTCTACTTVTGSTSGSVVPSVHKGPFTTSSSASTCITTGWNKTTCNACNKPSSEETLPLNPSNHEQTPVNVGTAETHRKYPCCNTPTDEIHQYEYTEKSWYPASCSSGDHTYFTYTATCDCGYTYDQQNYDIEPRTQTSANCTTQHKYDFYGYTPDGQSHSCPDYHYGKALGHLPNYPPNGGSESIHKICTRSGCGVTVEDGSGHSYTNGTLQWDEGGYTGECTAYYTKSCACGYSYTYFPTVYQKHYEDAKCTTDAKCDCYAYDGSGSMRSCPTTHYEDDPLGHLQGDLNRCTATCTSSGYNYYNCKRSGCNAVDAISKHCPALGHIETWGRTADTHRYCSRSGCTWKEGSSYHKYEPSTEPEWTKGTSKCSCVQPVECECGHSKNETLTVYQRDYDDATCTANATKECYIYLSGGGTDACPTTHEQSGTALGHDPYIDSDTSTCTSGGTITYKCERCKVTTGTLAASAKGHDWDDPGEVVVDQCETTCQNCGLVCYHHNAKNTGAISSVNDYVHDRERSCPDCGYTSWHFTLWPENYDLAMQGYDGYGEFQYLHTISWTKTARTHSGTCTACRDYISGNHDWNSSDYDNTSQASHTGITCNVCGYTCTHSNYGTTGWSSTYSYNANYHWQDFECGDCGFTTNTVDWYGSNSSALQLYAAHRYGSNNKCTMCGRTK